MTRRDQLLSQQTSDLRFVDDLAKVRAASQSLRARVLAISAYRQTRDVYHVTSVAYDALMRRGPNTLLDTMTRAMVQSHGSGVKRTALRLKAAGKFKRGLRLSSTYDSALQFLTDKANLSQGQLDALVQRYGQTAVQFLGGETLSLTRKLAQTMADSTAAGDGVEQGVKKLQDAFNAEGLTPTNPYALETLFRTQTQLAYSAGRMNALADPAVQEILWGYQYVTVGDDRVRPEHEAMDGYQAEKDDPIWDVWTPPNGYNCRCSLLEIFDHGTPSDQQPDVQPDPGFGFDPSALISDLSATIVDPAVPKLSRSLVLV